MQDLETALAQQAPPAQPDNPSLHELPPLVIDGIPTPVDKMTQVRETSLPSTPPSFPPFDTYEKVVDKKFLFHV